MKNLIKILFGLKNIVQFTSREGEEQTYTLRPDEVFPSPRLLCPYDQTDLIQRNDEKSKGYDPVQHVYCPNCKEYYMNLEDGPFTQHRIDHKARGNDKARKEKHDELVFIGKLLNAKQEDITGEDREIYKNMFVPTPFRMVLDSHVLD